MRWENYLSIIGRGIRFGNTLGIGYFANDRYAAGSVLDVHPDGILYLHRRFEEEDAKESQHKWYNTEGNTGGTVDGQVTIA